MKPYNVEWDVDTFRTYSNEISLLNISLDGSFELFHQQKSIFIFFMAQWQGVTSCIWIYVLIVCF